MATAMALNQDAPKRDANKMAQIKTIRAPAGKTGCNAFDRQYSRANNTSVYLQSFPAAKKPVENIGVTDCTTCRKAPPLTYSLLKIVLTCLKANRPHVARIEFDQQRDGGHYANEDHYCFRRCLDRYDDGPSRSRSSQTPWPKHFDLRDCRGGNKPPWVDGADAGRCQADRPRPFALSERRPVRAGGALTPQCALWR